MLGPFQRPLWWLARRIYKVERTGPFDFIDMRAERQQDHNELTATVREAAQKITEASAGFPELVEHHLRFVAAMDVQRGVLQASVRGYVHPFIGPTRTNPFVLACRLVWVASCIRLERDAATYKKPFDEQKIVEASNEAQRRFARQFPDADDWIRYLEESA